MKPSLGRIVLYRMTEVDCQIVAGRGKLNLPRPGDQYPAVIVRTFGSTTVNLSVLLDGESTYWATSRAEGDGESQWSWPPRV